MNQRTKSGQFLPGISGNPAGRPNCGAAEIRRQLSLHSNEVIEVVTNAALEGDLQACKMILDRISSPLKAQAAAISVKLPDNFCMSQVAKSFIEAAAEGALAPDVAGQMISAVRHLAHIVEVTELSDRLAALEESIKDR